ncbi:MAG: nucleotidyltransferase domain-containing protein [Planctomycetaceae bacterium]|jgi:predicted nucleotidyltransferase|nr:nucleotidyltransferase domain-containing protein [Planctomycetaceae bacterium]
MICVSDKELKIILDIIETYASDCEVRVFGSRYKGTAKDYSDLDLVFVGKEKLGINRTGELREAFEESDLPYRVDVLDWNSISENFKNIINKGYEIISAPKQK